MGEIADMMIGGDMCPCGSYLGGGYGCQRCRNRVVAEAPDLPPESCTCNAVRHPPCGFCEDSCECSVCGEFFYDPDNTKELPVCLQCDEAAA